MYDGPCKQTTAVSATDGGIKNQRRTIMPFHLKHSAKKSDPWWYIFKNDKGETMFPSRGTFSTKPLAIRSIKRLVNEIAKGSIAHKIMYRGKKVGTT